VRGKEGQIKMASQFGQDEYVLQLLRLLELEAPERRGFIVEAGAASPSHVSNSLAFLDAGYSLRLIEGDKRMSCEWSSIGGDIIIHEDYIPYQERGLDRALRAFGDLPIDFDALFLDINGGEYQLLEGMVEYRPKVICLEYDNAYPLNIDYVPRFFGYSPETGQASSKAFHRMMASKRYYFAKAFFQDHVYVSEEFLRLALSVDPDFPHGTHHYCKTAHQALYSPTVVLANQKEGEACQGVSFYQDKIRALASDGLHREAAEMYSYVLMHAMSINSSIDSTRSTSYCNQLRIALSKMIEEYCYLVNPLHT
jgi:hypothetical protein